jgi:hypothetical protein
MTYDHEQEYKKGLKQTPAQIKPAAAPKPKPTGLAQYLDDENDLGVEPL